MIDLTVADISKFIALGKSEAIEFKESFNEETLETVGAFSNARGAVILVGVTD